VTFELAANGTSRHVESRGGRVWLDGRQLDVDAVKVDHSWSVLLGRRSYEVALVEREPGELLVHVNGRAVVVRGGVQRFGARRGRPGSAGGGIASPGSQRVAAPMPGRIARVLVKAGDTVAARQGLVVVEAMKMENELRSPRAGTVSEVRVVAGALVEANAVLIVIE
jgi:biotin carboxyl carrier protein